VHLADYMDKGLTCLFSILGLLSVAYSGGHLCAGVHFLYWISNLGFSHRWLVSFTRGKTFENEHARRSVVESQLWNLNE
jgi:hypothetical protein